MRSLLRNGLLTCVALCGCGCEAVGAILHVAFGPPAVDAQYEPQKRPTLVLVENYQDQDASAVDGDMVARDVGDALHNHASLEVIDPDKVEPLRVEHAADYRQMSIPAVGRATGAQQVVYVNLVESETTADPTGAAVHATATARVRVVDVATGQILWPAGQPRGKELTAKMEYDQADSPQGAQMRAKLLGELSDQIAKLFYKWKPDTEQESNDAG
jgi:hypothetical protein